jgi:cell division protease FtsH
MNGMNRRKNPQNRPQPGGKQGIPMRYWMILIGIFLGLMIFNHYARPKEGIPQLSYSEFLTEAEKGEIQEVTFQGEKIFGLTRDEKKFESYGPHYPDLIERLRKNKIKVSVKSVSTGSWGSWLPTIFFIILLFWLMRR